MNAAEFCGDFFCPQWQTSNFARKLVRSVCKAQKACYISGSVGRSLLPSTVFLILPENTPLRPEDHLCKLFSLAVKGRTRKKKKKRSQFRDILGRWRAAAIDRKTFHAYQWCRKTVVLAVISRGSGLIWQVKAFNDQQCQFLTRDKSLSNENKSKCCPWLLSVCVPSRFCLGAPSASTVEVNSRFSRFQLSAFLLNGLASSMFIFALILLRFFFLISLFMRGLK